MDTTKLEEKDWRVMEEVLAGHLIQNTLMMGQAAAAQDMAATIALQSAIGVATQMLEDLLLLAVTGKASEEFLEVLAKMIAVQIKGMETKKEQSAREGNILLDKDDYEFLEQMERLRDMLPEVDLGDSDIVVPA